MNTTEDLRYPIGRFDPNVQWTDTSRRTSLEVIAAVPSTLHRAVGDLEDAQLDTPYRPRGWTVRQVVHHLADSYVHGYIRLKAALAEDNPIVRPYDQGAWATLPDSRASIAPSLAIVNALHERWMVLWGALGDHEFARTYTHVEMGPLTVETHLHFYAWHSGHHIAHVTSLRERAGW